MKRVIEVVIIVLLVSLVACGKKNNHGGSITKAPPSSPSEDVGQFAYRPPSSGAPGVKTPVLMSDYIYLENVKGDSNNKKLYAQMSLFWLKTPAADKTKTDQFQLYYREFVACQDGPRPANRGGVTNINSHLEVISGDANRAPKTKSILTLGDFGQFTKNAGKKIPLSGNLQIGHPINGYNFSLKPVV